MLVNTERPARDFTLIEHDSRTLIAAIDQFQPTITVYEVHRADSVGSQAEISVVTRVTDVGNRPVRLRAADVNGDGRDDLVVADAVGPNHVRLFIAESLTATDLVFRGTLEFGTQLRPADMALRDVDGDGLVDILVADDAAGEAALFLNTSGDFREAGRYHVGDGPLSVFDKDANRTSRISRDGIADIVLADLNGDPWLDMISTSRETNQVSVMLGDGSGHFLAPGFSMWPPVPEARRWPMSIRMV